MGDICYVIIVYGAQIANLLKLIKTLRGNYVVIVNNAKERYDEIAKATQSIIGQRVTLLTPLKNLGYGGGCNTGIKHALKKNFTWIVLLNDDISFTERTVQSLSIYLKKSKAGIYGPEGGTLDRKRWTTRLSKDNVQNAESIAYVSGSCIAVHRSVIKTVGLLCESYFMYYEDAELCIRAAYCGFPVKTIAVLGMQHGGGRSMGYDSYLHRYYLSRNHLLFVERNAPFYIKLREALRLPKTIFNHVIAKDLAAISGIFDYCFRKFGRKEGVL